MNDKLQNALRRLVQPFSAFYRTMPAEAQKLLVFIALFVFLFFVFAGGIISVEGPGFFLLIALFIFLAKSNRLILRHINPHPAVLLGIFFAGGFLQNIILSFIQQPTDYTQILTFPRFVFLKIAWLFMVWSAGLLFTNEVKQRQSFLIVAFLFLILAHNLLIFGHPINHWILFFFIFASLIKKTSWLENLSRAELGVYLIVIFAIYVQFQKPEYFDLAKTVAEESDRAFWIYSLPFVLFYTGKIYLLCLLIKIPLVLIYNYAPISRKLWIASLFQSTIPQFVQLILLLFIFFLFISGWQADNLRQEVYHLCSEALHKKVNTVQVKQISVEQLYRLTGNTKVFSQDLSIVTLNDYGKERKVLFFRSEDLEKDSLFVVTMDSTFLKELFNRTKLIVGTGILAYKFTPKTFLAYFYRVRFWQSGTIRINPLGLINPFFNLKNNDDLIIWPAGLPQKGEQGFWGWTHLQTFPIVVGRIFFPLDQEDTYFAMDIFYDLRDLFQWNFMTQVLLILVFVFFLINTLVIRRVVKLGVQINQLIVRRIDQLREAVRAISAGNLDYHISLKGDDEFTEFAQHFNRMSQDLKRFMREAREKERLNQELKIAHDVQLKMLPEHLPQIPSFRLAADLTTANEVGGDFYDLFALDEQNYLIAIGDVSGKGMSAAFYMAQIISLIRYSHPFINDLRKLILHLNEFLMREVLEANIFVTLTVGILNIRQNTFQFIRAGHTFPIVIQSGAQGLTLQEIRTRGIGLGMTPARKVLEKNLELGKIKLKPGHTLVLYTDGFTEATVETPEGEKIQYGEERFKQQLLRCYEPQPKQMLSCLKQDLNAFYGDKPRFDDQTIVILHKNEKNEK